MNHAESAYLEEDGARPTETRVTVVVLSFNRREEVLGNLQRLTRLTGRPSIIVVDNGSADGTPAAVEARFPRVTVIRLATNVGAAARNVGASLARTPYVAFSDDDTAWEPDAPARAADILDAYPRIAVISAHILVGEEGRDDPACIPMRESPLDSTGLPGKAILGFMAGACIVRVSAFLSTGGYLPELFIGGEEAPLALDLASRGWHMVYCPQVVTRHYPSPVRDARGRQWLLARNSIWTAWLRLPRTDALRATCHALQDLARRGLLMKGAWHTAHGILHILRRRSVVPPQVQAMWRATHGTR